MISMGAGTDEVYDSVYQTFKEDHIILMLFCKCDLPELNRTLIAMANFQ